MSSLLKVTTITFLGLVAACAEEPLLQSVRSQPGDEAHQAVSADDQSAPLAIRASDTFCPNSVLASAASVLCGPALNWEESPGDGSAKPVGAQSLILCACHADSTTAVTCPAGRSFTDKCEYEHKVVHYKWSESATACDQVVSLGIICDTMCSAQRLILREPGDRFACGGATSDDVKRKAVGGKVFP